MRPSVKPAVLALLLAVGTAAAALQMPKLKLPELPSLRYTPSPSFALEGWLDHTTTWVSDSSQAGSYPDNLLLHTGRFVVGAHGRLPWVGGLDYRLRTGATMAENSYYEQRIWTPELEAELGWTPVKQVRVGGFARYGWRRPNAFLADSMRWRDMIAGLKLRLRPLEHTELGVVAGNRLVMDEDDERDEDA